MGPRGPTCTLLRKDVVLISLSLPSPGCWICCQPQCWFGPLGLMDRRPRWTGGRKTASRVTTSRLSAHWSNRAARDDNRSLWSSWSVWVPTIDSSSLATGYCPSFQEIGRRFGPLDLAAIPHGAYLPSDEGTWIQKRLFRFIRPNSL